MTFYDVRDAINAARTIFETKHLNGQIKVMEQPSERLTIEVSLLYNWYARYIDNLLDEDRI